MYSYDTVSEAINGLKKRGFTIDFNLEADALHCPGLSLRLSPNDFEIVEVYRFEGNSDPGDEAIVYGIESNQQQKGVLVNAFGAYADSVSDDMIEKLRIHH